MRKQVYFPRVLLCGLLAVGLCFPILSSSRLYAQDSDTSAPAPLSPDQLNQLVAPIALYSDALVAQVLAGATYPTQVVEADRWVQANQGLSGQALADAVNTQEWDPSIKALTQFPSVLDNMSTNLDWTSALGQAYYYQPQDVLAAVQVMRRRAWNAKQLQSTPQQQVMDQGGSIIIVPANPQVVYVPSYNPWTMYGPPVETYPGYSTGALVATGVLAFGAGIAVGALANNSWGWNGWHTDWNRHHVVYQNNVYVSRSNNYWAPHREGYGNRGVQQNNINVANTRVNNFNRPAAPAMGERPAGNRPAGTRPPNLGAEPVRPRGPEANRNPVVANRGPEFSNRNPAGPNRNAPVPNRPPARDAAPRANPYRGFTTPPAQSRNAFANYNPGGQARAESARGRASFGPANVAPRGGGGRPAAPVGRPAPAGRPGGGAPRGRH